MKVDELYLLRRKLMEDATVSNKFRSEAGIAEYRQLLQDFETSCRTMSTERHKQYKNMRNTIRLMEDIDMEE